MYYNIDVSIANIVWFGEYVIMMSSSLGLESQKVKLTNEVCALYGNIVQDVAPGDMPNILYLQLSHVMYVLLLSLL